MAISPPLSILFVGPLLPGSTTIQRLRALRDLAHHVSEITTALPDNQARIKPSLISRLRGRMLGPSDQTGANAAIIRAVRKTVFNLIWVEKGLTIRPSTLNRLRDQQPGCLIIGFSPDDMMNPANQTKRFLRGLPLYHAYVTTKSYNVPELRTLGCPEVVFMENGFDPAVHRPVPTSSDDRKRWGGPVGFIGQWEPDRAATLRALAQAGLPVRVWGYTWERMRDVPANLTIENRPVWGDDYAKTICSCDINLCFLRKVNRDLQTTRSIEIPACGAFMLAERTDEHLRLFEEGREAEFFSSEEELIRKTRYYLEHPAERMAIAKAGLQRCLRDGYSYADRLRRVLDIICNSELNIRRS